MVNVIRAFPDLDESACPVCGSEMCERHLPPEPDDDDVPDDRAKPRKQAIAFTLDELARYRFPARLPILERDGCAILRAGHLGQINALRGVGKTWLLQTMALVAASDTRALGLSSAEPRRVLHVDGEMGSEELQDRYAVLRQKLAIPGDLPITIVAADWQDDFLPRLDTRTGQAYIEPYVDTADFIILDNRSCLFDPEGEKDAAKWQPAQNYLLSLRRRGKAVMIGHHSNRMGGSRGHSKAEDALNLMIQLTRPDGYTADLGARFIVSFEKSRGIHGSTVAPFTASLTPDGWTIDGATDQEDIATTKLREYLDLAHQAGDRPKSANSAIAKAKVGRNTGLAAWARLRTDGALREHADGGFYLG